MESDFEDRTVDIEKRRLARDINARIGGVFGIDIHDIEKAIERLWSGRLHPQDPDYRGNLLPGPVERAARLCDTIEAVAAQASQDSDQTALKGIQELVSALVRKLSKLDQN